MSDAKDEVIGPDDNAPAEGVYRAVSQEVLDYVWLERQHPGAGVKMQEELRLRGVQEHERLLRELEINFELNRRAQDRALWSMVFFGVVAVVLGVFGSVVAGAIIGVLDIAAVGAIFFVGAARRRPASGGVDVQ